MLKKGEEHTGPLAVPTQDRWAAPALQAAASCSKAQLSADRGPHSTSAPLSNLNNVHSDMQTHPEGGAGVSSRAIPLP